MSSRKISGKPLDLERLKRLLSYDPETGDICWGEFPRPGCVTGTLAGSVWGDGYRRIDIQGRMYMTHRLAVWLHTGQPVTGFVGFMDRNRSNTRWNNLIVGTLGQIAEARGYVKPGGKPGVRRLKKQNLWGAFDSAGKLILACSSYEGAASAHNQAVRTERDLSINEFCTAAVFQWPCHG